ncbi:hypothetical protein NDU88_001202 [Pleurodeles waltl]|uniref:Uncharacterized protein n=1 Tax=Pleurodeles waltl TaxID=8319 RepID=A0AAV7Q678_PLEWA|nr:hypothetical protein NDU88_001202 [Pleurodeles waltl]
MKAIDNLQKEKDTLQKEKDNLQKEKDSLQKERGDLIKTKNNLLNERVCTTLWTAGSWSSGQEQRSKAEAGYLITTIVNRQNEKGEPEPYTAREMPEKKRQHFIQEERLVVVEKVILQQYRDAPEDKKDWRWARTFAGN